jgi:WD40-like Beta Propeller Repeat
MSEVVYSTARSTRRHVGSVRLLSVLALALAAWILCSAPAWAGQARLLTGIFGEAGSTPADPYPLDRAGGVAVDSETHDVYVVDVEANRVEKFDSSGHLILMFGKGVDATTGGDVCTVASGDTCKDGTALSSPGGFDFGGIGGIAVDNSGVPGQQGDVYVSEFSGKIPKEEGVISKFNSDGGLIASWGNNSEGHAKNGPPNGQLNGSNATGTVTGPFKGIEAITVDPSGDLWVNDSSGSMFEFRPNSSFITAWRSPTSRSIAVEFETLAFEDNLYVNESKFDSTGVELGGVYPGAPSANGITHGHMENGLVVDPVSDDLYATANLGEGLGEHDVINRYESCHPVGQEKPCVPVESFGSNNIQTGGGLGGLAIDPSTAGDTLYAAEFGEVTNGVVLPARVLAFSVETVADVVTTKATGITGGSATLRGSVDPSGVELEPGLAGCRFEWGEHGAGESEAYGHNAPCDKTAAEIGAGSGPVEVHAEISGLQQGKIYHFRLVAGNHNQVNEVIDEPSLGSDLAFGPPSVESASAVSVGASDAVVQAQVNPNNVDTRVRAEYGTEAGVYDQSTSEVDLGSGGVSQSVSLQLSGLSPATVYHYRFVAESALGEGDEATVSSDRSFTTQVLGEGFRLPDGRAWELVSPPDMRGGEPFVFPEEGGLAQASATGDAFTFLAGLPTEAEPAGYTTEVQVLSRRTAAGWASNDISVPHEGATGTALAGFGAEYRFFSSDLSLSLVQPYGSFDAKDSSEASEQTPYLRSDYPGGEVESPCVASCYQPLVTGAPGYENVPPETAFAKDKGCELLCGPVFVGASPDLKHILLTSEIALVEGAPASKSGTGGSLYEWTAGKLTLVSVLPGGEPAPANTNPVLGHASEIARNAISPDGSRVVWSDSAGGLYVRDIAREETVPIGTGTALFQAANSGDSKIFFTEQDGRQADEGADLRECTIVEEGGKLHCEISDLSPVTAENAGVMGLIPGVSEDGSYVYFVSNGVMVNDGVAVPGAKPAECESLASTATCNLYVNHDGVIKLVATLSSRKDGTDWSGQGSLNLQPLTARVSPDGQWLAFMSDRSLTGYDNRDSVTGDLDAEVYLYNASADNGEGLLVCASCNPTGVRPHGRAVLSNERSSYASIAASIPGWTAYKEDDALYQSRYLSDSGRLFFDSYDALVPQDSNGAGDVYEYEPPGVGDCTSAGLMFAQSTGGCVGLISSGTSKESSVFVDASEDGNDVFFLTSAQLVHADTDSTSDVYDARVGGGFAEPLSPPVCEGDACQNPVSAPEDPTPGSLTYSGPANPINFSPATYVSKQKAKPLTRAQELAKALAACKRDKTKRARSKCEQNARARYGKTKVGRATIKKGKR